MLTRTVDLEISVAFGTFLFIFALKRLNVFLFISRHLPIVLTNPNSVNYLNCFQNL